MVGVSGLPCPKIQTWGTRHPAILLDFVNSIVDIKSMKSSEFKRWLEKQGATFTRGKGSHLKVELDGKFSVIPMHKSKEIGTGLVAKIKKDLGLN